MRDEVRLVWLAGIMFLALSVSRAQVECLPQACKETIIPDSTKVVILAIGKNDLYFLDKQEYLGDTLLVKGDLVKGKECEYSGTVLSTNNKLLYFSHVQLKILPGGSITLAADCRKGALTGMNLAEGTEVTLLVIHSSDIYSLIDPGLVGKKFKVKTELRNFKDCWYEGTLEDADRNMYVFMKIQVNSTEATGNRKQATGTNNSVPKNENGMFIDDLIPKGTRVKILDIASTDIAYEKKGIVIGKNGKASEDLKYLGDGWYSGSVITDDGSSYYFFKVALGPGEK